MTARDPGDCVDIAGRSASLQLVALSGIPPVNPAASLLMGQSNEGRPVVLVRGVPFPRREVTRANWFARVNSIYSASVSGGAMILALAGGVGGARLANGLAQLCLPDYPVVAVKTGDDFCHLGLRISPDLRLR